MTTEPSLVSLRGEPSPGEDPLVAHLEALNAIARIATLDLELRPMLQRITDTLATMFGWEFVACITIEDDRQQFVCDAVTSSVPTAIHVGYSRPLGSGVVGEVAATGRPTVVDDVREYHNYVETLPGAMSELCIPIRHGAQLVALLNLESTRLAAFHDQLRLVLTIAEQVAGAIANARRYEELKQRARLMEMMSEVSRTALETTDRQQLLDRIVEYVHAHFPVEYVAILLYDEERQEFEQTAFAGAFDTPKGSRWPTMGVIGRCVSRGRTQLVLDVTSDPDYVAINDIVQAELVVPIRFHQRILGVLNVESATAEVFTPANVFAFEAFADQVAGAIHLAGITHDLEEANGRLHRLSMIDALTGVPNRRRFDELLDIEWRRALRSERPMSLLMLDIDNFKQYNDQHGHQSGDDCLRAVASGLSQALHRAGDVVARYGGEEFIVLLPDTDGFHAAQTAGMLRARIAGGSPVTISVGVASMRPGRDADPSALIATADEALYRAKREGRNRVVVG
jgi:diguanylate cyclase (GGDEF)-like protein